MARDIRTRLAATARRPTPATATAVIIPALVLVLAAAAATAATAAVLYSPQSAPGTAAGLPRAYGEGDTQDETTGASLWIPPKMIAGNRYHGVVVMDRATADGSFILLSSTDGGGRTLILPESAAAPPHGNHAVFPITPVAGGAARVFAAVGGGLLEADTRVYLPRSVPASLDVIMAANTTEAPVMTGYVVVRDGNGAPTAVTRDLRVDLTAIGPLDPSAPDVLIRKGESSARFEAATRGSGSVVASADGLAQGRADVERTRGGPDVRIAVAPHIAMPDSYAFYYVWLERDGSPVRPPRVIDAYMHSDNGGIARFTPDPAHPGRHQDGGPDTGPGGHVIRLVDGMARGILYTGGTGPATVTASIPHLGSAQTSLFVGAVRADRVAAAAVDDTASTTTTTTTTGGGNLPSLAAIPDTAVVGRASLVEHSTPNTLMAWAYPGMTDGPAWVVAATYHVNKTESLRMIRGAAAVPAAVEESLIVPVPVAEGILLYLSSDGADGAGGGSGLAHKGVHMVEPLIMETNAVEMEVHGSAHGTHALSVSGQDLTAATASIDVVSEYGAGGSDGLGLAVTAIPAVYRTPQDLAVVSVIGPDGAMVDASGILGTDAAFAVHSSAMAAGAATGATIRPQHAGSAVIRGMLSAPATIGVTLEGVGSASVDVFPSGVAASLDVQAPPHVHAGEAFPFAAHAVDHAGIPLYLVDDPTLSPGVLRASAGTLSAAAPDPVVAATAAGGTVMVTSRAGTAPVSMVSDAGAATIDLESFENPMSVGLEIPGLRDILRVGGTMTVRATGAADGARHDIVTEFPYERVDDRTFLVRLDREADPSVITVTASRDGYAPASASSTVRVHKISAVDIRAADHSGIPGDHDPGNDSSKTTVQHRPAPRLPVTATVSTDGLGPAEVVLPYSTEVRASVLDIQLPEKTVVHGRGYLLDGVRVNGNPTPGDGGGTIEIDLAGDVRIDAAYVREVLVEVVGGTGSGVYRHGDTVTISAPDRPVLWVLIREVFDRWDVAYGSGADLLPTSSPDSITAVQDARITAVYRTDYTWLMAVIAAPLAAASVTVLYKNTSGFGWHLQNLLEAVASAVRRRTGKGRQAPKQAQGQKARPAK